VHRSPPWDEPDTLLSIGRFAFAIRRLRRLEVPLDEIRVLRDADLETLRARLAEHRERVAASTEDRRRLLVEIDRVMTREEELVPIEDMAIEVREVPELRLAALIRQLHIDEIAPAMPRLIDTVAAWIGERVAAPVGPPVSVFRSGDREDWHLVEAGWPVEPDFEPDERLGVHVYPRRRRPSTSTVARTRSWIRSRSGSSPPSVCAASATRSRSGSSTWATCAPGSSGRSNSEEPQRRSCTVRSSAFAAASCLAVGRARPKNAHTYASMRPKRANSW
jgi:hypothetical protein